MIVSTLFVAIGDVPFSILPAEELHLG
jgi:hypothetical protein